MTRTHLGNGTLQQLLEASDLVKLALAGTAKDYAVRR